MRALGWFCSLTLLGGAVSVGAAVGATPSRPLFTRGGAIAPPHRIPDALTDPAPPAGTPVAVSAIPKSVRRAVVADAARRFNVAENAVVLTRAEQLTWSDGSLGCPDPGVTYTQNLVAGYLIVAKTAGGELSYHTDAKHQAKTCGFARPNPRS